MTQYRLRTIALDEAGCAAVHAATIAVLEEVGVEVQHERAGDADPPDPPLARQSVVSNAVFPPAPPTPGVPVPPAPFAPTVTSY